MFFVLSYFSFNINNKITKEEHGKEREREGERESRGGDGSDPEVESELADLGRLVPAACGDDVVVDAHGGDPVRVGCNGPRGLALFGIPDPDVLVAIKVDREERGREREGKSERGEGRRILPSKEALATQFDKKGLHETTSSVCPCSV